MIGERSAQIRLAIPLVAQQLGFQLMGTVDAALLGRYDDVALAAAGVGNFLIAPGLLASLFSDRPAVIAATLPLLQIAAVFQLSDGTQAIAAGALRGIGKNRATFVGNLVGHYGVGLAISLSLAFGAGLGAPGLWWGLSAGLTVTAVYLVQRFLAGTRLPGATPG